jgi:hypothetical protein
MHSGHLNRRRTQSWKTILALMLFPMMACSSFQIQYHHDLRKLNKRPAMAVSAKKKINLNSNSNVVGSGSISSQGEVKVTILQGNKKSTAISGGLGVSKKPKMKSKLQSAKTKIMSQKDRQRTAGGNVDSTLQTRMANPEMEDVQVLEAKRGNKAVTIIRYVFMRLRCAIGHFILFCFSAALFFTIQNKLHLTFAAPTLVV